MNSGKNSWTTKTHKPFEKNMQLTFNQKQEEKKSIYEK